MRIKQCSRTNSSSAIFGTDRRNESASRLQWGGAPGGEGGCALSESVLNLIACPLTLRVRRSAEFPMLYQEALVYKQTHNVSLRNNNIADFTLNLQHDSTQLHSLLTSLMSRCLTLYNYCLSPKRGHGALTLTY